jgi:hypothetical protein
MSFPLICSLCTLAVGAVSHPPAENYSDYLHGTYWSVDGVPFEKSDREMYTFSPVPDDGEFMHWGNFISFTEGEFETNYRAPCGNDCFTTVAGTYRFTGLHTIHVHVTSVNYRGFCDKENGAAFSARYTLEFQGENLVVTKRPKQS